MLALDLNIQHLLVKIAFSPRPPQPLHLILLQLPPNKSLQFLLADLLVRFRLLIRSKTGLKSCLHANAHGCLEGDRGRIAANFHAASRLRALFRN